MLSDWALTFEDAGEVAAAGMTPERRAEAVDDHNVAEFVQLCCDSMLGSGVRRQLDAFMAGLHQVIVADHCRMFSPREMRSLLCGDERVQWDMETLLEHVVPEHGYS